MFEAGSGVPGSAPSVLVLGRMSEEARRRKLEELETPDPADQPGEGGDDDARYGPERGFWWDASPRPYEHTAHAFGHIAPGQAPRARWRISDVGAIAPDLSLVGRPLKVTLDRLRVYDYPGRGMHNIMVDVYAEHRSGEQTEHLHFNTAFRVMEGQRAAVVGHPLFVGLVAPPAGLSLRCVTINVKNASDERLIDALQSDVVRHGMALAATAQPALAPLLAFAKGTVEAVAARHRNVAVQEFSLGLDFSDTPMRARLALGSYVAVQIPDSTRVSWRWDEWVYDPASGEIVSSKDESALIPLNYLVFGVSGLPTG